MIDLEAEPGTPKVSISQWAPATFAILFAMHLLDYMDRNILSAIVPQLKDPKSGFGLSNHQIGMLTTCFLISYSLVNPAMGWAGDRFRRTWLIGLGVGLWSLATVASAYAQSFGQLMACRAVLGIGEATYGVIAPTLLIDLFSRERRSSILSAFYLAMPLGSALGLGLGATIAKRYGWQSAFLIVGTPGLIAAFLALLLPEPVRGASEKVSTDRLQAQERRGASKADYIDLAVNSSFTYSVFGQAAYVFAIGGLLVWIPYFLSSTRHIDQETANWTLGIVTFFAAITGMSLGGTISDRLARKDSRALFIVPGIAMLAAVPATLLGLFAHQPAAIYTGIFLAEAFMFVNVGPCVAILANVVTPNMRGTALAIATLMMHLLGDIWSPSLVGWVADYCGNPDTMARGFGHVLASIGAVPTPQGNGQPPQNLLAGLLITVPAIFISGIVFLAGARHLPREMDLMLAKLKAKTNESDEL
ncbi:MAG: sugar phosphate permease [Planctomycetota bacterium]|nr:sugar phosphate permease [Planctomycetota bacterium]